MCQIYFNLKNELNEWVSWSVEESQERERERTEILSKTEILSWTTFLINKEVKKVRKSPKLYCYQIRLLYIPHIRICQTTWEGWYSFSCPTYPRISLLSILAYHVRVYESENHSVVSNSLRPHGLYTVHGILQARIMEWAAFSGVSSQFRDRTQVSCTAGGFLTSWATREDREAI